MLSNKMTLTIPKDPKNVLALRLFISGVASRMGFDVADVEDIKMALAESAILMMSQNDFAHEITICVEEDEGIHICVQASSLQEQKKELEAEALDVELSRMMLESLVDDIAFVEEGEQLDRISFYKKLG